MIAVECSHCGEELDEPGALVFSPPDTPWGMVDKFHLCKSCWHEVRPWIIGKSVQLDLPEITLPPLWEITNNG